MPVAFRPLAATLAVGTLVGLVVAGGGSRLAMGVIARADDREDFGSITESQAVVGEITTAGTVDVLVAGMGLGIVGAFGYLGLRRWLPTGPVSAALVYAAVTLGVGLLLTVEGNRGDFVFLDTAVSLLSFAAADDPRPRPATAEPGGAARRRRDR